jgi:hypothetical protein
MQVVIEYDVLTKQWHKSMTVIKVTRYVRCVSCEVLSCEVWPVTSHTLIRLHVSLLLKVSDYHHVIVIITTFIIIIIVIIVTGAMRSAYKMHDYSKVPPPLTNPHPRFACSHAKQHS